MMWKSENKFYVVRKWKNTWIFNSREECKWNVIWFPNAKYKGFSCKKDADIALREWWEKYYTLKKSTKKNNIMNDNITDSFPLPEGYDVPKPIVKKHAEKVGA